MHIMQDRDYNLEFGLPHGCTKANCTYYVAMGPNAEDDKFLDVYLQGTADGWVAVGFSHTTLMVCVDAATWHTNCLLLGSHTSVKFNILPFYDQICIVMCIG